MLSPQLITLLTDLGTTDAYVGIIKGVLLTRAPQARTIDLTHAADAGSLYAAGYLLASAHPYFPPGTVHLVLTDPGASPNKRIIAAEVDAQYVIAPDDGVAGPLLDEHAPTAVVSVENSAFLLKASGHTFHERIIYAPAAAALVSGAAALSDLGPPVTQWTRLAHAKAAGDADGVIHGEVVHVDRFGNVVTNIRAEQLPLRPVIKIANAVIDGLSHSYADVERGCVLAMIGSTGNLEISINRGNAAQSLYVSPPTQVRVEPLNK
jgi:S-adenosylmethionine hydrolase